MKYKKDFIKIYIRLLLISYVVMGFGVIYMPDFNFYLFLIVPIVLLFIVAFIAVWQTWVRISKIVQSEKKTYKIKKK